MSRVFVLGNASVDITLRVPRQPLAGETLMAIAATRTPGGKGLNQAVVAARAGATVHFCAPLGRDADAALIRATLAAEPLHATLIDVDAPTDMSMLLVADDGENCIVSTGACADALPPEAARAFIADMTDDDILLVQGNLTEAITFAAVSTARRAVFNTAPLRWPAAGVAGRCAVVIANRVEAEQVTGFADPAAAAAHLGGAAGIVTLGEQGCILADGTAFPAVPAIAVDTTGAGDAFCGALVAALARGAGLPEAIAAAQRAAAVAVSRAGCYAALPTCTDLSG